MTEKVSFEQVLKAQFDRGMAEVYTAMPCRITNIPSDLEDARVDVQPIINTLYDDSVSEEHSQILSVPVVFPSSKTSMVSFPLFVGDVVLCIFSQASLDAFKQGTTSPSAPSDYRVFDSRDAIAIPCVTPFGKSLNKAAVRSWPHSTKDLVVAHNISTGSEVELRMKPSGDLVINTNQNVAVNCRDAAVTCDNATVTASSQIGLYAPNMTVSVTNTTWNGNITMAGTYTLGGIVMNTHKHTGVQAGPSQTGGPV